VQEIDERAHSAAPPERVFALLAAVHSWPCIRWHSTFKGKLPGLGPAIAFTLRKFIARTAEELARGAEAAE
jgi:hypothetical protein